MIQKKTLREFGELVFRTACLLGLFMLIDKWVMSVSHLSEDRFFQPVLLLEVLKHSLSSTARIGLTVAILLVLVIRWRFVFRPWAGLEHGDAIRWFVTLLAFLLAWWFGTYDYNLYFNQSHYYDRFMLVVLVGLIYWRPVFVLPFLLLVAVLAWQSFYPIGGFSWAHQSMPLRLMMVFFAGFLLQAISGSPRTNDWLFLGACIVAAHYWIPGLNKMKLDWISYGHVYNFLPSTYANGWLGFLSFDQISALTRNIMFLDKPIQIGTLLLQLGSVFLLWRRFTLVGLLFLWAVFHLGVLAISGILFWQWMILESAFLLLIRSIWAQQPVPFVGKGYFVLSAALIAATPLWISPVGLAWYDMPISYTVRLVGVTEDNQRYSLPPRFFEPYEFQFSLGNFRYLGKEPQLSITWGASSDRQLADLLLQAQTPEQVREIERNRGKNRYDQTKALRFDAFIQAFIATLNQRKSKSTALSVLHAPRQIWTFSRDDVYEIQTPLVRVDVYQITSFFDGKRYQEIDHRHIRSIDIPSDIPVRGQ